MQGDHPSRRSQCPIAFALDLFGDRWTLLIVRDMAFKGRHSYGDFLNAEEAISTNILAERLKRLQLAGVVSKQRDPTHGSKFIYHLTDKGLDLIPTLLEMIRWSGRYDADTTVPAAFLKQLEDDPQALARQLRQSAQKLE